MGNAEPDQALEGTDHVRVKFLGAKYDTRVPDLNVGRELEFTVKGVLIGDGRRRKRDGTMGYHVDLEITSVVPNSFEEPADPNKPQALPLEGDES